MVSGVSRVQVYGAQKYAVRVQVDPDKLAARGIGIDEVQKAIAAQQRQPAHRPAVRRAAGLHHAIQRRADARRGLPAHHRGLRNGVPMRLEQLANVIDSVENDKLIAWFNGVRGMILAVNASPAPTRWKWWTTSSAAAEFAPKIPPAVKLEVAFDASESIRGPFTTWNSRCC
jgi:hydrophobic/amphiphilic exporter-1 (mainly G- bacteria), HAE1 family